MRNFFANALFKFRQFMVGRYGSFDEICIALIVLSCLLTLLSNFRRLWFLYPLAILVMGLILWRMLSKNIAKRSDERMKFLQLMEKPREEVRFLSNKIRDRKTHKYFKCKNCGATLRIPKGKGKINVTCPKCRFKVQKKT